MPKTTSTNIQSHTGEAIDNRVNKQCINHPEATKTLYEFLGMSKCEYRDWLITRLTHDRLEHLRLTDIRLKQFKNRLRAVT
jgi:expansin (peptidoglycan-binding protein)